MRNRTGTLPPRAGYSGMAMDMEIKQLEKYRSRVYYFSFIAYALLHITRKSYVNLKVVLNADAGYSPVLLSAMDTSFMLFYALGALCFGSLGDVYNAPAVIAAGLCGSAVCMLLFAVLLWVNLADSGNALETYAPPLVRKNIYCYQENIENY